MFDNLRRYIDEVESTAESTREFINKLNGAIRRQTNAIEKAEAQIKLMRDERKYVAGIKPQIQKDALKLSKDILFNNVLKALRTNKEFDEEVYRLRLFEAVEDNDTYIVRITGTGFESRVAVDVLLDKSAGRLNMWAAAIKAVRSELGVVIPRKDAKRYRKAAIRASLAWRRLYESGAYISTVQKRLAAAAKTAPFWSILNFGTPPVGAMSSDRGGFSTPKNRPTNFVDSAEREISSAVAGLFDTARENYYTLFEQYNSFLEEALISQQRLRDLAEEIRLDRGVVRQLERKYNIEVDRQNRNSLEKAVDLVRKGIKTQGKISILTTSGKRRVLSAGVIKEFLAEYG
jgi:hypothetical protein